MLQNQKKIRFTVVENDAAKVIEAHHGEYPNLMFLLRDQLFLESFGECGGVGRCATCIVKTKGIKGNSNLKERNEPATLSKLGITEDGIRLSCQIYITNDLEGCEIEILEF